MKINNRVFWTYNKFVCYCINLIRKHYLIQRNNSTSQDVWNYYCDVPASPVWRSMRSNGGGFSQGLAKVERCVHMLCNQRVAWQIYSVCCICIFSTWFAIRCVQSQWVGGEVIVTVELSQFSTSLLSILKEFWSLIFSNCCHEEIFTHNILLSSKLIFIVSQRFYVTTACNLVYRIGVHLHFLWASSLLLFICDVSCTGTSLVTQLTVARLN